ncbi:MAG: hypothetical protein K2I04_06235, partial [Muribaculaceae bacterium]|nr:hypothetical protein [Muribaculaceae bacterium]
HQSKQKALISPHIPFKMRKTYFKNITALLVLLFLAMTTSCVSRKNCLVCNDITERSHFYTFLRFDSTYTSVKSLKNRWILDSVLNAVPIPLSDSLIILTIRGFVDETPYISVKSGSKLINIQYRDALKLSDSHIPVVEYSDFNADISLAGKTIFSWDIDRLISVLSCAPSYWSEPSFYTIIRLTQKNGKIKDWEEYRFERPNTWKDCTDSIRKGLFSED